MRPHLHQIPLSRPYTLCFRRTYRAVSSLLPNALAPLNTDTDSGQTKCRERQAAGASLGVLVLQSSCGARVSPGAGLPHGLYILRAPIYTARSERFFLCFWEDPSRTMRCSRSFTIRCFYLFPYLERIWCTSIDVACLCATWGSREHLTR